jgi:exopolysaccharide biosynthesis polyprenyl glycosylphosphotransferase
MSPTKFELDIRVNSPRREGLCTALDLHAPKSSIGIGRTRVPSTQQLPGSEVHADCVFDRLQWQRKWARNLRVTDTVVVCGSVLLGQYVRFGQVITPTVGVRWVIPAMSVIFAATWLIALVALRTRSPRLVGTGIEEYRRLLAASFWTFGAIAIASLLFQLEISRGYLAIGLPTGVVGLLLSRAIWRGHVSRERARGKYQTAVLVVGETDAAVHFANELTRESLSGYRIVGLSVPGYGAPRGECVEVHDRRVPILGDERYVLNALSTCDADTVAIAGTEHFGVKGIRRLIWDLEPKGIDLIVSTGVMDVALSRLVMRPSAGLPVLHIEKPKYQDAKKLQKRFFDIWFACIALSVGMPLLLLAAIAIKLTSRGPVFYRAERIGMEGQPFLMIKLRTMVQDADKQLERLLTANECDGALFKIRNDPRITPVGRLLRRFSIDEFPQFINVLRGQMSVVGPRPPLRREVDAYDCDVVRRLLVKPGVTGLWQVSGRSDLSWDESVRLDLAYVDNWSMVGDSFIIAKTVVAVFSRKGAY